MIVSFKQCLTNTNIWTFKQQNFYFVRKHRLDDMRVDPQRASISYYNKVIIILQHGISTFGQQNSSFEKAKPVCVISGVNYESVLPHRLIVKFLACYQ